MWFDYNRVYFNTVIYGFIWYLSMAKLVLICHSLLIVILLLLNVVEQWSPLGSIKYCVLQQGGMEYKWFRKYNVRIHCILLIFTIIVVHLVDLFTENSTANLQTKNVFKFPLGEQFIEIQIESTELDLVTRNEIGSKVKLVHLDMTAKYKYPASLYS